MAQIIINGNSYIGRSVTVSNNQIIIDNIDVTPESKQITIQIEGNVEKINVDKCNSVNINGNADMVTTMSGDVTVKGDIHGNVKTMSGDVEADKIQGSISTMSGDITYKR